MRPGHEPRPSPHDKKHFNNRGTVRLAPAPLQIRPHDRRQSRRRSPGRFDLALKDRAADIDRLSIRVLADSSIAGELLPSGRVTHPR